MDFAPLGIEIANGATPDGNVSQYISFDDYSINPWQFTYGPQPPDFNGTQFQLKPFNDRDDATLGVALFFAEVFDKLLICKFFRHVPAGSADRIPSTGLCTDARALQAVSQHWRHQQAIAELGRAASASWRSTLVLLLERELE